MKKALFDLVSALSKSGYDKDSIHIQCDDDGTTGVKVILDVPIRDVVIEVSIGERVFGLCYYYVNFRTITGDFSCYMGTPFIEKALMNLGGAIQSANNFNLRNEK